MAAEKKQKARSERPEELDSKGPAGDLATASNEPSAASSDEETNLSRREEITVPPPERTPLASLHHWGLLGRIFARLFFSRIFFPVECAEAIRKAAEQGTVVYVLRLRATLELVYFNYAFTAHGLPLARFANGVRAFFWMPFKLLWRQLFRSEQRDPVETLRRLTLAHRSSALFLRHADLSPPADFKGPYFDTLVELQKQADKPIIFVPITVLWGRGRHVVRPAEARRSVLDRLIGNQDEPRTLRRFLQLVRDAKRSLAVVCEPLNLADFIAAREGDSTAQIATAVHTELTNRIRDERRVRIGPRRAHFVEIRRRILDRPQIKAVIAERAEAAGQSLQRVRKKARRILKKMQAQLSARGIARMSGLTRRFLWRRSFEGFEVDEAGIARVQEANKDGPLLFLPTHRSHVDYLVLSDLISARDLVPPHIAAGANLSFWPLGWLFRTAGAFFIRRKNAGDQLYAALLRGYIGELLREGHNLEIFIEGGRTRTGAVLHPRLGLLSIVADLAASGEIPPVQVIPCSIGYERVMEIKSLTKELSGGRKRPESAGGLLKAARMLRKTRAYGYINVQFGPPIDLRRFLAQRGYYGEKTAPEKRHNAIRSVGYHALSAASAITAITPTSLVASALLAPGTRGVKQHTLQSALTVIHSVALTAPEVRIAGGVDPNQTPYPTQAIERALEMLARDQVVRTLGSGHDRVYVSEDSERIRGAYYKNQILQHLVGPALMSLVLRALRVRNEPPFSWETVRDACQFVASLVRQHFVLHAGERLDDLIIDARKRLEQAKVIELVSGGAIALAPGAEQQIAFLSGLVESQIESHGATAQALLALRAGPMTRETAQREVLATLQRRHLVGELRRHESCQMPLIAIATDWLVNEGIIVQRHTASGALELELARQHADGHALEVLIERSEALLPNV